MKVKQALCAPFIRQGDTVRSMMSDVIIALMPSAIWGVYAFGLRALSILLISIFSCVLTELLTEKLLRKKVTLSNLSAPVTGMIFALTLPVGIPLYLIPLGALLAIGVAKSAFGGLGKNPFNPALFAHGVLYLIFPEKMRLWIPPFTEISPFSVSLSQESLQNSVSSTLLERSREGILSEEIDYSALITGSVAGGIGEVSALLVLAGLLYLLVRGIISWHIPFSFVGTVALLAFLFPYGIAARGDFVLLSLLSGGTLFGAVFAATDPVTSPVTAPGKILYGIFCGAALYLFRAKFGDAGSVAFAIVAAGILSRLFDLPFRPRPYGTRRSALVRFWESLVLFWERVKELPEKTGQKK